MTADHCDLQVKRLLILKGIPEDVCEYFAALSDVPDALFTMAVNHALRTRTWFPTPADLRADCDAVAVVVPITSVPQFEDLPVGARAVLVLKHPANGIDIRIPITRVWRFDCERCSDTGWQSNECPTEPCGRQGVHASHSWVERCTCLDGNPTIRRRRAVGAKYSRPAEKTA